MQKARKEIEAQLRANKAVNHALILVLATMDDLEDSLNEYEGTK